MTKTESLTLALSDCVQMADHGHERPLVLAYDPNRAEFQIIASTNHESIWIALVTDRLLPVCILVPEIARSILTYDRAEAYAFAISAMLHYPNHRQALPLLSDFALEYHNTFTGELI